MPNLIRLAIIFNYYRDPFSIQCFWCSENGGGGREEGKTADLVGKALARRGCSLVVYNNKADIAYCSTITFTSRFKCSPLYMQKVFDLLVIVTKVHHQ